MGALARSPLLPLAVLLLVSAAPAETEREKEYRTKAAFLYQFPQYTTWPKEAFGKPEDPFVIAVLGTDPFGKALDKLAENKVGIRPIHIRRIREAKDAKGVHLLFIASKEVEEVEKIMKALGDAPILTVADAAGLARVGAMVAFYLDGGKVRFEVNVDAVERGKLSLSARLLNLARIVRPGKEKESERESEKE